MHLSPGGAAPQIRLPLPPLQLPRESRELLAPLLPEPVQEARSAVSWGGVGGSGVVVKSHCRFPADVCADDDPPPPGINQAEDLNPDGFIGATTQLACVHS